MEPSFVITPHGHFTKTHMDVGPGFHVHFIASGTKIWVLFPPMPDNLKNFKTREWGHISDVSLEHMCLLAEKVHLIITRPGSVFIHPPNWLHAVFTVHADPVAIHTSMEILHQDFVEDAVEGIIPPSAAASTKVARLQMPIGSMTFLRYSKIHAFVQHSQGIGSERSKKA